MNIILFDELSVWQNLLPLTFTRPVSKLRIGILTIDEKWKLFFPQAEISFLTQEHLKKKFPLKCEEENLFINASILPDFQLVSLIYEMQAESGLKSENYSIAFKGTLDTFKNFDWSNATLYSSTVTSIQHVYDIFTKNGEAIESDFKLITKNRESNTLSDTVMVIGNKNLIFLEEGAIAEACIINTRSGPVYLGKDSEIMEGSVIRGPFSLCEHSTLKMSAKIYGPTTIGPHCKVGGEVNNSMILGYSNKAHDGFLGNSVIGEWCNLGADTNNSNLKNNYACVKIYNYLESKMIDTGLQFCGLIMGDYSKSGINTMFNTGTVIGVGANVYGSGFPPAHIPSFSWGGSAGFETYKLEKLFETTEKVYERRNLKFDKTEQELLKFVFEQTKRDR